MVTRTGTRFELGLLEKFIYIYIYILYIYITSISSNPWFAVLVVL